MNSNSLSVIEHYEQLSPVITNLYAHMEQIAQIALLPLFLLSIFFAYTHDLGLTGTVLKRLKALVITALLLAAFPDASEMIRNLGQQLALSIDGLKGLDQVFEAASKKMNAYSDDPLYLLTLSNDLLLRFFVNTSFTILFFARLGLVAFYHFYWMFLVAVAPLLILGCLFDATKVLPKNLFKNLILVAMWPVAWSLLSVFLEAVPYTNAYQTEGGYTALIILNLIIAVSMFLSPFLLSSFCEGLLVSSGPTIYGAAKAATFAVAPKMMAATKLVANKGMKPSRSSTEHPFAAPRSKQPCWLIFLLTAGFAGSVSAADLKVSPNKFLVLCLHKSPAKAFLSDSQNFDAKILGKDKLLLRARASEKSSSLLVLYKSGNLQQFNLRSDSTLPAPSSHGCDSLASRKARTTRRENPLASRANKHLRVELKKVFWTNKARDFLNVEITLENRSSQSLRPQWSKILLKGKIEHALSRLWAERSTLASSSKIKARLEFKRPEINLDTKATLLIPAADTTLSIQIPKEVLK